MRDGFEVAAFDIFNDIETRRLCFHSRQVDFADGGFDPDHLQRALDELGWAGEALVYGSGLERDPAVLDWLAERFALNGNAAETVAAVKTPLRFFDLLASLDLPHPLTSLQPPADPASWLVKQAGGSGGTHVKPWDGKASGYYQQQVEGIPVSLLFAADARNIRVVGYNRQWLAPGSGMPFRYGGAAGDAQLPEEAKAAMRDAAGAIAAAAGLRGLNSIDFMLTPNGPLVLEVNPRLSASFALYDDPGASPSLFSLHLDACRGLLRPFDRKGPTRAHLIYYAPFDVVMDAAWSWPAWTADRPSLGAFCRVDEPLCSIYAEAAREEDAQALVFARAQELDAQLRTF